MCLNLNVRRWKKRARSVKPLLCLVSGGKPKWNYFLLQYHQSDSAPTYCSFLFIPIALLSPFSITLYLFLRSSVHGQGIQPKVPHLSVIFQSPGCSPTLHLLCFLPTCFVLLMGHCEAINSQHSVSESAHQRRVGLKHSHIRILLIPQPKEKYPHGPQLSQKCVIVNVSVCACEVVCVCLCACVCVWKRRRDHAEERESDG